MSTFIHFGRKELKLRSTLFLCLVVHLCILCSLISLVFLMKIIFLLELDEVALNSWEPSLEYVSFINKCYSPV